MSGAGFLAETGDAFWWWWKSSTRWLWDARKCRKGIAFSGIYSLTTKFESIGKSNTDSPQSDKCRKIPKGEI